jgi:hypothetical protein
MFVTTVPNRGSRPAVLLRESYREDGKVKSRTLANLSDWPEEKVQTLRAALRGDRLVPAGKGGFEIRRSLPHGHVLAALTTARRIGLDVLLPRRGPQRRRDLILALIIARLLDSAAKLATARMLDPATASHSLGETLGLGIVPVREIYAALDWLVSEQSFIENNLARRHLTAEQSGAAATVRSYKSLARVERAFRSMKTVDIEIRPVFHWTAPRVRAHVLLCMLAYYLEWHMRRALAPVLFDDEDKAAAEASRASPVVKARVSQAARKKASARLSDPVHGEVLPVHGFRTLLADLGTLTKNTVCFGGESEFTVLAKPTEVQRRALGLLGAELTPM